MLKVLWQDVPYEVTRIVMADDVRSRFQTVLAPIVERYKLSLSNENTAPCPGDFWIGCSPRTGWADADPYRIAWASSLEAREALRSLTTQLPRHRRESVSLMRLLFPTQVRSAVAVA